jgi:hypothetical protein
MRVFAIPMMTGKLSPVMNSASDVRNAAIMQMSNQNVWSAALSITIEKNQVRVDLEGAATSVTLHIRKAIKPVLYKFAKRESTDPAVSQGTDSL